MEFTTDSSARTLRFQRVLHTGGGRRARGSESNLNGIIYAVAVKTDVEIIVGNLLRQILTVLFFCVGAVQLCARSQAAGERQQISQKEV